MTLGEEGTKVLLARFDGKYYKYGKIGHGLASIRGKVQVKNQGKAALTANADRASR
jgi:hypothetical protein